MTASVRTWQTLADERDLQDALMMAALRAGYYAYHTYDSRRSPVGFPDVVAVRDGRTLVFEVKKQSGRVSLEQRAWIEALDQVPGVTAAIVRPNPKPGEISFDQALSLIAGETL